MFKGIDVRMVGALIVFVFITIICSAARAAPFTTSKDGELVFDHATRLIWMRCSVGQTWNGSTCAGQSRKIKFKDLTPGKTGINTRGSTKWRLPSALELVSLTSCENGFSRDALAAVVDAQSTGKDVGGASLCSNSQKSGPPSIDLRIFPNTPLESYAQSGNDVYWSTTLTEGPSSIAIGYKEATSYATSVRIIHPYAGDKYAHGRFVVASDLDRTPFKDQFWFLDEEKIQNELENLKATSLDLSWQQVNDLKLKTVPTHPITMPQFVSLIVIRARELFEFQSRNLPTVSQVPPAQVVTVNLMKEEFETTAVYQARLALAQAHAQKAEDERVARAQASRAQEIQARAAAEARLLADLNSPSAYRRWIEQAWSELAPELLGSPVLNRLEYDADKQQFSATLGASRAAFTQTVVLPVPLAQAPALKRDLLSGKVAPKIQFKFPDLEVAWALEESAVQRERRFFAAKDSIPALTMLIAEFPNSSEANLSRVRIPELQRLAYRKAVERDSVAAYDEFLRDFSGADTQKLVPLAQKARLAAVSREKKAAVEWERDRPQREARERSRNSCQIQINTCIAACPVNRYSDGSVMGPEYSCKSRCESVSCN